MGDDFKKLKGRLDDAGLDDVLPGFDREQAWAELKQRIPAKKSKPLVGWWSHAAALVAGLLIGAMLIKSLSEQEVAAPVPVVAEQQDVTPTIIQRTDTVYVVQESESKIKGQKPTVQPSNHKSEPVIVQAPEPVQQEATIPDTPETQQEVVVAKQQPTPARPIHLLDIENEDRQTALYHNDAEASHKRGFVLQLSPKGLPDNKTNKAPTLLSPLLKQ